MANNSSGAVVNLRFTHEKGEQKILDYKRNDSAYVDHVREIEHGHQIIGIYGLLTAGNIALLGFIVAKV